MTKKVVAENLLASILSTSHSALRYFFLFIFYMNWYNTSSLSLFPSFTPV